MGVNVNAQRESRNPYVTAIDRVMRLSFRIGISPWLWLRPIAYLTGFQAKYRQCLSVAKGFTHQVSEATQNKQTNKQTNKKQTATIACRLFKVIADRRAEFDASTLQEPRKQRAFLDLLLSQGALLSDEDVCDEVETFMFAGHDTTASGKIYLANFLSIIVVVFFQAW